MFKHTGKIAVENRDLKNIQQIKTMTFESIKNRDLAIEKLQNLTRTLLERANRNQEEIQRQNNAYAAAKSQQDQQQQRQQQQQQLKLKQQQQKLLHQQQLYNQQQQMLKSKQVQEEQHRVKTMGKHQKETFFDNLDDDESASNSEVYSNESSDDST